MLPLAHIYTATEVAKKKTPLLVFGSVMPDISTSSGDKIKRSEIHDNPTKFYDFVSDNYPNLSDLALGVMLHGGREKGADYYSDGWNDYVGFAYKEGKILWKDVSELLDLEEADQRVYVLSHNFIEAGVDLLLMGKTTDPLKLYEDALGDINRTSVAACMADYLRIRQDVILREINNFADMFGPGAYVSKNGVAAGIANLIKKRLRKDVQLEKTEQILHLAQKKMALKYADYLNNAIGNMKSDFRQLVCS